LWLIDYAQNRFGEGFVKVFHLSRVNPTRGMIPLISSQTPEETSGVTETHLSRLIAECIAGSEDAIEMFVREYEAGVFRLALSLLGEEAEANEVTQETFLSALRALPSYQEKKSLKAWLYTIALNHSRSHLRKRKIIERLHSTLTGIFRLEVEKQASPEEAVIQNEKEAVLWRSLNQLDERYRVVVVLRYFHEMSISETGRYRSLQTAQRTREVTRCPQAPARRVS
jgi:RNA polymerase sigma-70 factor (ECF subfamily)